MRIAKRTAHMTKKTAPAQMPNVKIERRPISSHTTDDSFEKGGMRPRASLNHAVVRNPKATTTAGIVATSNTRFRTTSKLERTETGGARVGSGVMSEASAVSTSAAV